MKTISKFILFSFVMALSITARAQGDSTQQKKNIIKLNLTSLIFTNFSFQYERVLSRKTSVALGIGIRPKSGLPFKNKLMEQFGSNSDAAKAIEETKFSNFNITPEFRYYVGKKGAPRGFYIAPFLRYSTMKLDQMYRFTPSDGIKHVANIKGSINSFGGGVMFGAQYNLSKKITLDWWILGGAVGKSKGTLIGTDPINIPAQDRANIKNDIEDVDFPGLDMKATVEQNKITVKWDGPYYALRTFGLALGFKF